MTAMLNKASERAFTGGEPRIHSRAFQNEEDWWRVRRLLIETFPISGAGFNWEIRHWDGNRYHCDGPSWDFEQYKDFHLWETEEGELAGVAHLEGNDDLQLQIHPRFRYIEEEMIAWSEENFAAHNQDGKRQLQICVFEYDAPRQWLLEQRGYEKMTYGWILRRMRLCNQPIAQPKIAEGYVMRTTRVKDEEDCQRIATLLNIAFERPNFHKREEYYNFITRSPSFRRDLNLVAEAPDGSFASHVGLTYDPANRFAIFEPVCTHPDHRKKGLAQNLMLEGLHRLNAIGAKIVEVGTGDSPAANALYNSIGFTEVYKAYYWKKIF